MQTGPAFRPAFFSTKAHPNALGQAHFSAPPPPSFSSFSSQSFSCPPSQFSHLSFNLGPCCITQTHTPLPPETSNPECNPSKADQSSRKPRTTRKMHCVTTTEFTTSPLCFEKSAENQICEPSSMRILLRSVPRNWHLFSGNLFLEWA